MRDTGYPASRILTSLPPLHKTTPMPMIHVARDGAKLGEFTLEQIREGLTTGQFRATDLAWQSGMAEWRPLSEVVGAAAVPPAAGAPPTLPAIAPGVTAPPAGSGLPWEHR